MKRVFSMVLCSLMTFSLFSCSNGTKKEIQSSENIASSHNELYFDLSENYSDKYVSFNYSPDWTDYKDPYNGPAFKLSEATSIIVYYSFFDVDKISNDVYIKNHIPNNADDPNEYIYTNKKGFSFFNDKVQNEHRFFYATADCLVNIVFIDFSEEYNSVKYDFLDSVEILASIAHNSVVTTTKRTTRPIVTTSVAAQTKSFSGSGDFVSEAFSAKGCTRLKGTYTGEGTFFVTLYDDEANFQALIFSNMGEYSGEKVFQFKEDKKYLLEVTSSSGDWNISIE